MTDIHHQSAGDIKSRMPKEMYAVMVTGRDRNNRKTRALMTFLNKGPARDLYDRVKKMNDEVTLMHAVVSEWSEVECVGSTDGDSEDNSLETLKKIAQGNKKRAKIEARIRLQRRKASALRVNQ